MLYKTALWYIKKRNNKLKLNEIGIESKNALIDKIDKGIHNSFIILLEKLNMSAGLVSDKNKSKSLKEYFSANIREAEVAISTKFCAEVDKFLVVNNTIKPIEDESRKPSVDIH